MSQFLCKNTCVRPMIVSQYIFLFRLIHSYGYYIIFPLIVIEGPATIFISGFFVSLGLLNPFTTYLIIVSADLFGDILYYSAGRWWINSVSKKVLKFFNITEEHFINFKKTFTRHKGKIMFFGKLSSFVGGLVMYIAGLVDVPVSEFLLINGFGALFKTLLLLIAGFYFGSAASYLGKSFDSLAKVGLVLISVALFLIYWAITSFSNKYIKKAER